MPKRPLTDVKGVVDYLRGAEHHWTEKKIRQLAYRKANPHVKVNASLK